MCCGVILTMCVRQESSDTINHTTTSTTTTTPTTTASTTTVDTTNNDVSPQLLSPLALTHYSSAPLLIVILAKPTEALAMYFSQEATRW